MADPPIFGDWQNGGKDVQYTKYFDAQKGRVVGNPVNPDDPSRVQASPARTKIEPESQKTKERNLIGRDRNIHPRYTSSPVSHEDGSLKSGTIGLAANVSPRRVQTTGVGSDRSMEKSPLDPRIQAKMSPAGQKGGLSPSNRVFTPTHPSTPKSALRDESESDKGVTIPRFGDWNPEDPAAGEKFTGTFERVKNEKVENSPKVPSLQMDPERNRHSTGKADSGCWCFCRSRD